MATNLDILINSIVSGTYGKDDDPPVTPQRVVFGTKSKISLSSPGAKLYFADIPVAADGDSEQLTFDDDSLTDYFGQDITLIRIHGIYIEVRSGPQVDVELPGDILAAQGDPSAVTVVKSMLFDLGDTGDLIATYNSMTLTNNDANLDGVYRVAVWGSDL